MTKKIEFDFSRKRMHSFIANAKLKGDQTNRKFEAKFEKLFLKNQKIFKVKTTIDFQVMTQIQYF